MPRTRPPYPVEFRRETVELVRQGRSIADVAKSLGVSDHQFDLRVVAVIGVERAQRLAAVGREREVPPVGKQLGLRADQAGAAHDQTPLAERGSSSNGADEVVER